MRSGSSFIAVASQGAAAVVALTLLPLWPPPTGRLLLVPLTSGSAQAVAGAALAGGALILGAGPLPGSLVVVGNRASIARRLQPWSIAVTAAPSVLCGSDAAGEGPR